MKAIVTVAFLSLLITACAKRPVAVTPVNIDPGKVETILLPDTAEAQGACENELHRVGARILYRGEAGLLFTDKKAGELPLKRCRATVTGNTVIALADVPREGQPRPDLPTLLRLIPAEEIGARSFVEANPSFDGRGVIVAVLDTGIEVDHPMLTKTSDGKNKVVAFHDFSGQGRVELSPATPGPDGTIAADGGIYSVKDINGEGFHFGIFKGSTLEYNEGIAKLDTFEDIGVITYLSEGSWKGRVDTDNDKAFEDETDLFDFGQSQKFVKLGKKKTLTSTLTIAPDGKTATLCFDDGSHGTHVAGIAAGYDPEGLRGVAPGAQVVGVKIGDNRLAGGSTTTASMLLAIDYAVQKKAQVINLSYGIRSGSNLGKSAIDQYVDRIAREKGVLFAISAGNEGPGLLTIGTPAGANLAITNAAFLSRQTARDNYGYNGVEEDNVWYFSSVGPRLDGGMKPTLLAPGTALSSVPQMMGGHQNYRGTSMASPQVTGGLALILSAAGQSKLPTDRATVTRAVYRSATFLPNLKLVEQGHGLMNVKKAYEALKAMKGKLTVEYEVSVNNPVSPDGKGAGIFVSGSRAPQNGFTVAVTPVFPAGTTTDVKDKLRTFRLVPSAPWIRVPSALWMHAAPRSFQVDLEMAGLKAGELHSEKISAIDEKTEATAFEIPVTVIAPVELKDESRHTFVWEGTVKVGKVQRLFVALPAGATAVHVDLESDGPTVQGQLLDPEGRHVVDLIDPERTEPQPPLLGEGTIARAGVYEIDLNAPPFNRRFAKVRVKLQAFGIETALGTPRGPGQIDLGVLNHFAPIKLVPKLDIKTASRRKLVEITGNSTMVPFSVTDEDKKNYTGIRFTVATAKRLYDLMTDYPYRVFTQEGKLVSSGGLELRTDINLAMGDLDRAGLGKFSLELYGAFAESAPPRWSVDLTEERTLMSPTNLFTGSRILIETGQSISIPLDLARLTPAARDFEACGTLTLQLPSGRKVRELRVCR